MNGEQNLNKPQHPACFIPRVIGSLSFFNADNLEIMRGFKDNEFDLAIVDPPYGDFNGTIERTGGSWSKKYQRDNSIKKWDFAPSEEYFKELFRISKEQIIWGGNYFDLPPSKHFLIWEKQTISESFSMATTQIMQVALKMVMAKDGIFQMLGLPVDLK